MGTRASNYSTALLGIGLYTPIEAAGLLSISSSKITRWLRGHDLAGAHYDRLWKPQIELSDGSLCLSFRDLQEVRVADAFIRKGLSAFRVRQTIARARDLIGEERPLSTARFRTDGRSIFLEVMEEDGETRLVDLFKQQYAFREILERSLSNLEYDDRGLPARWWPLGRSESIVLDPSRSFGQPIEAETSVPVAVLTAAVTSEGTIEAAAKVWDVPVRAIRRAMAFQNQPSLPKAA